MKKFRVNIRMVGLLPNPLVVKRYFPTGNYRRVDTSRTVTLIGEKLCAQWRTDTEGVGFGLLAIISKVKREIKSNEASIKWPTESECRSPYCSITEWNGTASLLELDLSAAYVRAAHSIGAIGDATRDRLLSITKRSRLIALGATATRKTETIYRNGVACEVTTVQDKLGKRFFDALSYKVAATMEKLQAAAGHDFAYYWADAIFVRTPEGATCVIERAKKLGVVIKDPEAVEGKIIGPIIKMADGRTFPARTIARNPFLKGITNGGGDIRVISGPKGKEQLTSSEELRILWNMARNKEALKTDEGLRLYQSLPLIEEYNKGAKP